jgi:hypothetical protein
MDKPQIYTYKVGLVKLEVQNFHWQLLSDIWQKDKETENFIANLVTHPRYLSVNGRYLEQRDLAFLRDPTRLIQTNEEPTWELNGNQTIAFRVSRDLTAYQPVNHQDVRIFPTPIWDEVMSFHDFKDYEIRIELVSKDKNSVNLTGQIYDMSLGSYVNAFLRESFSKMVFVRELDPKTGESRLLTLASLDYELNVPAFDAFYMYRFTEGDQPNDKWTGESDLPGTFRLKIKFHFTGATKTYQFSLDSIVLLNAVCHLAPQAKKLSFLQVGNGENLFRLGKVWSRYRNADSIWTSSF